MTEKFAQIGDVKLCYEILGKEDGYPTLLIHGFGVKKEVWMAQVGDLSQHFKVIRFDNRGSGKSSRPSGANMDIFTEDIKNFLDYLQIEKTHVMGWSLGGMIAQNFILKYPEKVNKLVLSDTFGELKTFREKVLGFSQVIGFRIYKILGGKIDTWLNTPNPCIEDNLTPLELYEKHGTYVLRGFIMDVLTGHPS